MTDYDKHNELYISTLYSLIAKLKEIGTITLDDSSKELYVTTNIKNDLESTFTIFFQIEHSSFTLLTKRDFAVETFEKRNIVKNAIELDPIAAYQYTNDPETMITHWCYDKEKILDTIEYLKQLESTNQIVNLQYSNNQVSETDEQKGRNV